MLFSSHQLDLVEDICEDVVIISAGRVVRAGDLAELRAEVPQRFVTVRYRGGAPDWSRSPGVEVVDQRDVETRLSVDQGADLAAMIATAQHDTDLVAFAYQPPTLSELFREQWRHERRAPDLARRSPRDPPARRSRAFPASLLLMLLVVVAAIALPALLDTGPGTQGRGAHRGDAGWAHRRRAGTR